MKLDISGTARVAVVALSGKLTIGEAHLILRDAITELLKDHPRLIQLDMADVSYVDSWGIAELVVCYKLGKEEGCSIQVRNPSRKVADVLRLTLLDEVLEVVGQVEDAAGDDSVPRRAGGAKAFVDQSR